MATPRLCRGCGQVHDLLRPCPHKPSPVDAIFEPKPGTDLGPLTIAKIVKARDILRKNDSNRKRQEFAQALAEGRIPVNLPTKRTAVPVNPPFPRDAVPVVVGISDTAKPTASAGKNARCPTCKQRIRKPKKRKRAKRG